MAGGGGGGFLRRLVRVHKREDFPPMSFEADWSAISAAGLSEVFKELLADFVGVPPDPNKKKQRRLGWHFWSSADIRDIYSQKHFAEGAENGFLVRGVIYDMSALIRANNRSLSSQPLSVNPGKDLDPRKSKDWTSLIHENLNLESRVEVGKLQNVDASEVMERLGLKGVVGIEERVGISKSRTDSKKNKLEAKQALEEIIGTGDSIRAKYAERIQHKKMMAEARREQAKLGITPTAAPRLKGPGAGLQAMPGSPALVRYLEERGLNQALLAHGLEGDLETLLDQIGNYQFQVIRGIQNVSNASPTGEVLSKELLKGICSDWGLPTKQVMVVTGPGAEGERILEMVKDSGFFVCQVDDSTKEDVGIEQQGSSALLSNKEVHATGKSGERSKTFPSAEKHMSISNGLTENMRIFWWLKKLSEGTLHIDDENVMAGVSTRGNEVNFSVRDMVELKWVIEDLNGVSYRSSTLVRGFEGVVANV